MSRSILKLAAIATFATCAFLSTSSGAQSSAAGTTAQEKSFSERLQELSLAAKAKPREAEIDARKLLADAEAQYGPESVEAAQVMELISETMWRGVKARDPEAQKLAERALSLKEQRLGPNHPQVAASLKNLGNLLQTRGDLPAAKPYYERALVILEAQGGKEDAELGRVLNGLANLLWKQSDYTRAIRAHERAIQVRERAFGPDHPEVAQSLNGLGAVLIFIKDYARAAKIFERCLEINLKHLGPDHPEVAANLTNLAVARENLGQVGSAREVYQRALTTYEKAYGPDSPYVASALQNLAVTAKKLGDLPQARRLQERAVAVAEKSGLHRNLATHMALLAVLHWLEGNVTQANELLARATLMMEDEYGPEHYRTCGCYSTKALFLADAGQHELAANLALRCAETRLKHVRNTASGLAEREALIFARQGGYGDLDRSLLLMAQGHVKNPDLVRQAFDVLVRYRAIVLDEMASRQRLASAADPAVIHLARAVSVARERLANLAVRGPGQTTAAEYQQALANAQTEKEKAEHLLAEKSEGFRVEEARKQVGLKEVVSALASDNALVSFYEIGTGGGENGFHERELLPRSYMAFLLRGKAAPKVVLLGDSQQIAAAVAAWRKEVVSPATSSGLSRVRLAQYNRAARELRKLVWDPVAAHLKNARTVFIVPDGALNLVNFAALPLPGGEFVVESGPAIHYLSTERDLISHPAQPAGRVLLAGAPAFDLAPASATQLIARSSAPAGVTARRSACQALRSMQFEPLPASRREIADIAAVFSSGRIVRATRSSSSGPVVTLTGAEANERNLKQQAPGSRVLHLATHGFFLGGDCALQLGDKAVGTIASDSPLLLSGVVLAGANRRDQVDGGEDGVLTAEEIASLDLSSVEWAVLSACDTGLGEIKAGEGVLGLRRAFQIAGARTLIMSLWQVEDDATRAWMRELYRGRFIERQLTITAVRDASLKLLRERRARGQSTHPFYWAGFVAAGDWR